MLPQIKNLLKKSETFSSVNSSFKSYLTKNKYNALVKHYNHLQPKVINSNRKKISRIDYADGLNILYLGTDELQDKSGLLSAIETHGNVTYFTRADGSYGQNDPDFKRKRENNSKRLDELFAELCSKNQTPNILIAQTWSSYIQPELLGEISAKYGTYIINIGMDDRHLWNIIKPLLPYIDLALTAAPECVSWYEKEGCKAIFFPEASDPDIFHPMPEETKTVDVSFVGGCYGIRKEIVSAIKDNGIKITAYGNGWENGKIAIDDVPKLFAQSKVILGVGTIGHCRDFYSLKLRDFDAPMSGSFYLTHDNPDLYNLYEVGSEIATYNTVSDCVKKIEYYLKNETEREKIAVAGLHRALKEHSWKNRFSLLFEELFPS